MGSVVLQQLDRFGPSRCEALTVGEARAWANELATRHYENFTVVSRLLPATRREHFAAVYAFCRWADDLGDETGDCDESLRLLSWWRQELGLCYAGKPRHPVFVALEPTVQRFAIPAEPFEDLIDAFEQDQRIDRYATWGQVLDYCTRSANPVGRLVLHLSESADEPRLALSDQTCTALQLVNFWQDVRRDIVERNRIYVPADLLAERDLTHDHLVGHVDGSAPLDREAMTGYKHVMRLAMARTQPMFTEGRQLWPMIDKPMRLPIKLFTLGGEAVASSIRRIDYDTLNRRPSLSRWTKMRLMGKAMIGKAVGA